MRTPRSFNCASARAEELEACTAASIRTPAHEVAGAVEPRTGCVSERIRKKTVRCGRRPSSVAARDAVATDEELPDRADGNEAQLAIEDVHAHTRERPAERRRLARARGVDLGVLRDRHTGFGRTVGVDQATAALPAHEKLARRCFASDDDRAHARHFVRIDLAQHRRREEERVDPARA